MASSSVLAKLETAVLDACAHEREWPAQVAAGIYAGIDYALAHPEIGGSLEEQWPYEVLTGRIAGFLEAKAPKDRDLPACTAEALAGGLVRVVGDHLVAGRHRRLTENRSDLVLLTLLPYLSYEEAQEWADRAERSRSSV
jgi:hypothetical protein